MFAQNGIGIGQVFFGLASIVTIAAAPACGGAPSGDGTSSSGTSNVATESGCAADPAITVCPGGSAGYRCTGAAVPDTSLDCSAGPPASGGETLYCCSGSMNQSATAGSSGAGSSGTAPAVGSIGSIGSGGIGSASGGPGASSSTGGTNSTSSTSSTGSSGSAAIGSGDAGSQGGSTASFVGTWDLSGTLTFSDCTNRSDDGSGTETRSIAWALGGPGLVGTGPSCTFQDTVSGHTASFAASTPSCTVPIQSTGEVDVYAVQTFTWTLAADGATAQVNEVARETATYSDGSTASCQLTFVQTATRE